MKRTSLKKILVKLGMVSALFALASPLLAAAGGAQGAEELPGLAMKAGLVLEDEAEYDGSESVEIYVELDTEPVLSVESFSGRRTLSVLNAADIEKEQKSFEERLREELSDAADEAELLYEYALVDNAVALRLPYDRLDEIREMEGVKSVCVLPELYLLDEFEDEEAEPDSAGEALAAEESADQEAEGTAPDEETEEDAEEYALETLAEKSYKGTGRLIAVIDTGINFTHELFAAAPSVTTLSEADIEALAGQLNALANYNKKHISAPLSAASFAEKTHKSEKIVFQYDYGDNDCDATDGAGHGTHVAGIAAGNEGVNSSVKSAAPDAQLIIMRVGNGGSISAAAVLAAMEDAVYLGADVVNMSIGSPMGFVSSDSWTGIGKIIEKLSDAGIAVAAAAGNEMNSIYNGSSSYKFSKTNNLAMNPDYGAISTPSSLDGILSVANAQGSGSSKSIYSNSSWGPTSTLGLKPDISAMGTSIYSSYAGGTSSYESQTGTSMASPYVAGTLAVLKSYVEDSFSELSGDAEAVSLRTATLAMNGAEIISAGGVSPSPRRQGAGIINLENSLLSKAYVTVPGSKLPKIELSDDPERTGEYELEIEIHNFSESDLNYTLSGSVASDAAINSSKITSNGVTKALRMDRQTPYKLSSAIETQNVSVPAGESKSVSVKLSLNETDRNYLDTNFENGCYVEGFLILTPAAEDENAVLSVPYMGFYGDWTEAAAFDRGSYTDDLSGLFNYSQMYSAEVTTRGKSGSSYYLGDNPYFDGIPYLSDRNAISPNGDGALDNIASMKFGLLRNAVSVTRTVSSADGKTVYSKETLNYVPKTYYSGSIKASVGDKSGYSFSNWKGTNAAGKTLANDTRALCRVEAVLEFDGHEQKNELSVIEFPITIDTEKPELVSAIFTASMEEGNDEVKLIAEVSDNQYVARAAAYRDDALSDMLFEKAVAEENAKASTRLEVDASAWGLSEGDTLYFVVQDYAGNYKLEEVEVSFNYGDEYEISVVQAEHGTLSLDKEKGYAGERVSITAEPEEGYELSYVTVDGEKIEGTSFKISGEHTVSGVFELRKYTIRDEGFSEGAYENLRTDALANGDGLWQAIRGSTVNVSVAPGCTIKKLYVNGEEIEGTSFEIRDDVVIRADIEKHSESEVLASREYDDGFAWVFYGDHELYITGGEHGAFEWFAGVYDADGRFLYSYEGGGSADGDAGRVLADIPEKGARLKLFFASEGGLAPLYENGAAELGGSGPEGL